MVFCSSELDSEPRIRYSLASYMSSILRIKSEDNLVSHKLIAFQFAFRCYVCRAFGSVICESNQLI